ncbi:MAG TPA: lipocalin family protein [Candidatus Binatia bacterium]
MFKDLFDKGKCALGFHTGEWRYLQDGSCEQTRICSRCRVASQQLVHPWQTWDYESSNDCRMSRRCGRCAEAESKVEHVWASPIYASEQSCALVHPCSRCKETSPAGNAHVWQSWSYDTANNCSQVLGCSRCGESGSERRTVHDWGAWQSSQFYDAPVRVCRRCAEMVFNFDDQGEQNQVSLQMVDRAVWNVMEATDSAGVRERLSQNKKVLFDPVAEKYFKFAIDQRAPDESARNTFRQLAGLIERCRSEGIEAVFAPAASQASAYAAASSSVGPGRTPSSAPAGEKNARVVGHWRHTEARSSGGFSMAIDTHCVLDPSGRFEWWSKSMSSFGPSTSGPENGTWSASGNMLNLNFDDGTILAREVVIENTTMFWPGDGRYRLWERIS